MLTHLDATCGMAFPTAATPPSTPSLRDRKREHVTRMEGRRGLPFEWNEATSVFADVDYAFDLAGSDDNSFGDALASIARWPSRRS